VLTPFSMFIIFTGRTESYLGKIKEIEVQANKNDKYIQVLPCIDLNLNLFVIRKTSKTDRLALN
jgi:hypothetical protein